MSNGLSITQWLIVFASVVLIALPNSQPFAEAEFEVTKDKKNATALVTAKKLDLTIDRGSNYKPPPGEKFDLIVGGCTLTIRASNQGGSVVQFNIDNDPFNNPTSLTITEKNVKFFHAGKSENIFCKNGVKFEEKDGKILLDVKLSGDIPENLKLSSSSANTYNPNGDNEGGLSAGAIAGISVASVAALLLAIGGGVGGYFGYRAYKRKKQAKLNNKAQLKTAVNVENGLESKSKTLDKSKLKDDKKDEREEKKERRKGSDKDSEERSESVKKHKRDKKKERRKESDKHSKERSESVKKHKKSKKHKKKVYSPIRSDKEEHSPPSKIEN